MSLTGCSTIGAMNPINWWHRQEGGKIAEDRPAPPGADAAYPNLSTVPGKPEPPDKETMQKLTDSLIADRTNAQHAAQAAPLADPSSPSASPSLFGVGTTPPPPPAVTTTQPSGGAPAGPAASASIPAVSAPAAPPTAAPRKAVQSAPLAAATPLPADTAPAAAAPPQTAPGTAAAVPAAPVLTAQPQTAQTQTAQPQTAQTQTAQTQPALPPAPPPRPEVAGSPPPPAPTTAPPMPASGSSGASIVFVADSSQLLQPAADEVKAFAGKRGNAVISVTGYGDATSADPAAQAQAVTLGLARAQAIVAALRADGVPAEAIRVNAEASGRGAALHLLQ